MSSGACRALVAMLLTIVATIVMAAPITAKTEQLDETATVTYKVDPAKRTISVVVTVVLTPQAQAWQAQEWEEIRVEQRAVPTTIAGYEVEAARDLPGPWRAVNVRTPRIPSGESGKFLVRYTLDADPSTSRAVSLLTPARIDGSYLYFCLTGQDTDKGSVRVDIDGASEWSMTQLGTTLESTNSGFRSTNPNQPGRIFTCVEGVREGQLAKDQFIGPADRPVELQAWASWPNWLPAAREVATPTLRDIHEFLGYGIPGEGPLIIRQAPSRDIGGYASAHSTPGVVQLAESLTDPTSYTHELAHAWFGTDNFQNVWLREGMADWTATSMAGATCPAVTTNLDGLELADEDWLVINPQAPSDIEERKAAQDAAACGIVTAVTERMPAERWNEVIGSMLLGETKYIGSAGAEIGTSTGVDYREWLDAVDERGLVPAAADPAYAGNLDDLDFAQDLLDTFGIPADPGELELRSEARAAYHQFLEDVAPFGAPHAVRKDMDDWNFTQAMKRIDKSYEVFEAVTEADRLLPEADLLAIVRPTFEAAKDEAELDAVVQYAQDLQKGAERVAVPLQELLDAMPLGWSWPQAITRAIAEQRFDDISTASRPAREVAEQVSAGHEALPQAGLLEKYRVPFETAVNSAALESLARDAATDRRNAENAGNRLADLQTRVGEWVIPAAVTAPLEAGQLQEGIAVIADALAVVSAASEADQTLPQAGMRDEVRPRFEAVASPAEMKALRTQVEARAAEAVAVGNALNRLAALVPDWQIPAVVTDPVEARDFATAVKTASAARKWVEEASKADESLDVLNAMERMKPDFEAAASLEDLESGAALAEDWAEAADHVARAISEAAKERDMITSFGLWGIDVDTIVEEAVAAAVAGEVTIALAKANEAVAKLRDGASSGSLRLVGIVFFGVAVIGVLGLWVMLRRQAGPSWARSTKPHWIEGDGKRRGLLGSGEKTEKAKAKPKPKPKMPPRR